ncbi:MAG: hypothetical protein Q9222_006410 [Ikaeria aurantiellina]
MAPTAATLTPRSAADSSKTRRLPFHSGKTNDAEPSHAEAEDNKIHIIDPAGDLLLLVHYSESVTERYRVSISTLRKHSSYFDALLDGSKFQEGAAVQSTLKALLRTYPSDSSLPLHGLPTVNIQDVRIGPPLCGIGISRKAFELFLKTLHECVDWVITKKRLHRKPIILASFAHYAERFAAIPFVSHSAQAQLGKSLSHETMLGLPNQDEEEVRQRLYAGLVLGIRRWVYIQSAILINWGSPKWVEDIERIEEYPWDYLGGGIEGNNLLSTRRKGAENEQRNSGAAGNAYSILLPPYNNTFSGSTALGRCNANCAMIHHLSATLSNLEK